MLCDLNEYKMDILRSKYKIYSQSINLSAGALSQILREHDFDFKKILTNVIEIQTKCLLLMCIIAPQSASDMTKSAIYQKKNARTNLSNFIL